MRVLNQLRLQVFLSRQGVCSRRHAMTLIQQGRVSVNGSLVREPSTPVDQKRDRVCVDGREVLRKASTYILLHKPVGYITTTTQRFPQKTIMELLPAVYRHLKPAGRLDKDRTFFRTLTIDAFSAKD